MSGRAAADAPVVDRNVRLVKILGLTRAGYTPVEISHVLHLSVEHVRREVKTATRCQGELVGMLAGGREWAHVFPGY